MKVVILGGCGFLGLHIAKKLMHEGIDFLLIDSKERLAKLTSIKKQQTLEIKYPYQNLEVLKTVLREHDTVIHLGWSHVPNDNPVSYRNDIIHNIAISAELFHISTVIGVKKIILASSGGAVYGNSKQPQIDETFPTSPISSYGVAKLAAEKYLSLITKQSCTSFTTFRIGNAYGNHLLPGHSPTGLIPLLIKNIQSGALTEIWGNGQANRDFIHVEDIARAFITAVNADYQGVYNLGTGRKTSIKQLIALIENHLGKSASIVWKPSRKCDPQNVVLDYSKFETLSGWRPKVSLDQGINKIIKEMEPTSDD